MKKYCFGVDVGGTSVKFGLFDETGTLKNKWEIPTNKKEKGIFILSEITESIQKKQEAFGLLEEQVQGIGMGVPGSVLEDGTVLGCVNIGWGVFNIKEEMEKRTGFATWIGNDANVAALGEQWQGAAQGFSNVVMVTLGTGVGGGVIINGKIIEGTNGAAGEIGHMCMNKKESLVCNCGGKGCLEQYASATGIVRLAQRALIAHPSTPSCLKQIKEVTAKAVLDGAKEQDFICMEVAQEFGDYLGRAMAQIGCIVNPQAFVLGGGVAKAGLFLTELVQSSYEKNVYFAARSTAFLLAQLGNDAGIYGGAGMVLSKI